jgi:hypothetical protein
VVCAVQHARAGIRGQARQALRWAIQTQEPRRGTSGAFWVPEASGTSLLGKSFCKSFSEV